MALCDVHVKLTPDESACGIPMPNRWMGQVMTLLNSISTVQYARLIKGNSRIHMRDRLVTVDHICPDCLDNPELAMVMLRAQG